MSLRCRLGLHDWRLISYEDPKPGELRPVFRRNMGCQRCHQKRTLTLSRLRDGYIPPGGVEVQMGRVGETFHWPTTDITTEESLLTCVRPMTREAGTLRDGSTPPRAPCGHHFRDHGKVVYLGDGRYRLESGACRHCGCEGFLG